MSVTVETSPAALDIHVDGLDRLWGLRGRLEIPWARVIEARVQSTGAAKADLWLRTGGLGFPGLAAVGHFRGRQAKRQWWRVYRADRVVVIEFGPESHFQRVVLEVDDPDATAARINAAKANDERGRA